MKIDNRNEQERDIMNSYRENYIGAKSFNWQMFLSIMLSFDVFVFIIIWLIFFGGNYHIYQNTAVITSSLLLMGLIIGTPITYLRLQFIPESERAAWKSSAFRFRAWLSSAALTAFLLFMPLWLFFYAIDHTLIQNIAIILFALLLSVSLIVAAWTPWGMYFGKEDCFNC